MFSSPAQSDRFDIGGYHGELDSDEEVWRQIEHVCGLQDHPLQDAPHDDDFDYDEAILMPGCFLPLRPRSSHSCRTNGGWSKTASVKTLWRTVLISGLLWCGRISVPSAPKLLRQAHQGRSWKSNWRRCLDSWLCMCCCPRLWMRSTQKLGASRFWTVWCPVLFRQVRAEKALPLVPSFAETRKPANPEPPKPKPSADECNQARSSHFAGSCLL